MINWFGDFPCGTGFSQEGVFPAKAGPTYASAYRSYRTVSSKVRGSLIE